MRDATYIFKKFRSYSCKCGAKPHRPLQASDTFMAPFPKPCDVCGADLKDQPFVIEDRMVWWRALMAGVIKRKENDEKK